MSNPTHVFEKIKSRANATGGIYAGSKAALAHIANTLRSELRPFGVNVISVMTGAVDTRTIDHHKEQYVLPANSVYKPIEKQIGARARGDDGVKRLPAAEYAKQVVAEVIKETNGSIWKGGFAEFVLQDHAELKTTTVKISVGLTRTFGP